MFRVEFFCDDKKLSEALRALMGVAHGAPSVMPVENVIRTKNGLLPANGGSGMERFSHLLKQNLKSGEDVTGGDIRQMMKAAGMNPTSSNYFLVNGAKAGLLRKQGKGTKTTYKVL